MTQFNNNYLGGGYQPFGINYLQPQTVTAPTVRAMNYNAPAISAAPQLIQVSGLESAKAYPTVPNSTVALFDSNEDIMYIKSTDASNFPTIRRFRFVEENEPKQQMVTDQFVTVDEFAKFKEEIKGEILDAKQSVQSANSNSKWKSNSRNEQSSANKRNDGSVEEQQ